MKPSLFNTFGHGGIVEMRVRVTGYVKAAIQLFLVLAFLGLTAAKQTQAGVIVYTVQDIATGMLGANPFTSALVTLILTGDTASAHFVGSTITQNKGPATVTIFGLGTANFTDPLITAYTDLNGPGGAGRCGISGTGGTVMGTVNASCAGYTLASAIGPLSGTGTDNSNFSFATDQGMFHLSSVSTPSTFTATVPEPRSTAMLVISLALIGAYHRRKRQLSR